MSDRQIADALGISEKTVRNHTSNIYRKLHIFDRTQAVIYAVREGVIDVEELEYRPPREPHRNLGTLTGPAPDLDLPAQTLDPLAHRREPYARPSRPGIESPTIVGDLYQNRFVIRPQPHLDIPRSGVTPYVRQGLLQNAQQLYALLSRETYREPLLDD